MASAILLSSSYHLSLWLFIGKCVNAPLQAAPCQAPVSHPTMTSAALPSLSKISRVSRGPISLPRSSFHLLLSQQALNQTHVPTNHPGLSSHHLLLRRAAEYHPREASVQLDATNPEDSYPKAIKHRFGETLRLPFLPDIPRHASSHLVYLWSTAPSFHLLATTSLWPVKARPQCPSVATPSGARWAVLWPPRLADHSPCLHPHESNLVMLNSDRKLLQCPSANGLWQRLFLAQGLPGSWSHQKYPGHQVGDVLTTYS